MFEAISTENVTIKNKLLISPGRFDPIFELQWARQQKKWKDLAAGPQQAYSERQILFLITQTSPGHDQAVIACKLTPGTFLSRFRSLCFFRLSFFSQNGNFNTLNQTIFFSSPHLGLVKHYGMRLANHLDWEWSGREYIKRYRSLSHRTNGISFSRRNAKKFYCQCHFYYLPKNVTTGRFFNEDKIGKNFFRISKIFVCRIFYALIKKNGPSSFSNSIITTIWEHFRFVKYIFMMSHFFHSISITVRSYVMHIPPGCFLLHWKIREEKKCPFFGLVSGLIAGASEKKNSKS